MAYRIPLQREGIEVEIGTMRMGTELSRRAVYQHGVYVGEIVYVRRPRQARFAEIGWRPAQSDPRVKLTTQWEAIERLPHFKKVEVV